LFCHSVMKCVFSSDVTKPLISSSHCPGCTFSHNYTYAEGKT